MTRTPLEFRSPVPVASLHYASPKLALPESVLPRVSFWCGFLAMSLGTLVVPTEFFQYHRPAPDAGDLWFLLLLCGQCLLIGAGLAVFICEVARRWGQPRRNRRLLVALLCNGVGLIVVACELRTVGHGLSGAHWIKISNVI